MLANEQALNALALAFIDSDSKALLTDAERRIADRIEAGPSTSLVRETRAAIRRGDDPLGDAFIRLRKPAVRRKAGAVYTPHAIVQSMLAWAESEDTPTRVIDPGAGSGRFLIAAAARFPHAKLVGIELDPAAALLLRANLCVLGLTGRTSVIVDDYREANLETTTGPTLFIGNPPYVRHHDISGRWKHWYADVAKAFGVKASTLAGLHLHFFVRTLQLARKGDFGTYITSAEWLDVNYGSALRKLLASRLGGVALHVLEPVTFPFADALTTGAITCFRVDHRPEAMRVRTVPTTGALDDLSTGKPVPWGILENAPRWSIVVRPTPKPPAGFIELGNLFRVSRGQVTGGNSIWIAGEQAKELPGRILKPTVTKARELLLAGECLALPDLLRKVVDLPVDLDEFEGEERVAVERFLSWARQQGAADSYVARHRRAWWSVLLYDPAPIMCTYMARRPPAFVRNLCGARHINIAHGLYPRQPLPENTIKALLGYLRNHVGMSSGRTYAGGLTKFEPKELERIPIPSLEILQDDASAAMDKRTAYC